MIDKLNLREDVYYIGTCRNTNIARWHKGKFIFINYEFGNPYIETINYYGDVKEMSIDGFIPMEEIKINVDNIIDERNNQDYKNSARKIYQNLSIDDLKGEIWRSVPEYEGLYYVSNLGRILKHGYPDGDKIMRQNISERYLVVGLSDWNGKRRTHRVHRLVARAFKKNKNLALEVNHINGIRTDNRESNLEWIQHSENSKHTYLSGNYSKKLTPEDVIEIKKMLKKGVVQKNIAKKFNVSTTTICEINKNKKWIDVPDRVSRAKYPREKYYISNNKLILNTNYNGNNRKNRC